MIKALEWLIVGVLGFAVWVSAILNMRSLDLSPVGTHLVLYFPVYAAFLFALSSVLIIAYRTTTFQDCPAAAAELQSQIKDAKNDLTKRGFKF